jgi:hypothetical protein
VASRYWVGGGSSTNWSATASTNWAATSGGAGNQSVPTTTDDVFFDAVSPSPSVLSANITVRSVNCTGYTGTITHNSGVTLTINTGSTTSFLLESGMTYTAAAATSLVTFTHTSGTADVTSGGKRLGGLTVNGAGGTTRLLDALRTDLFATSALTITSGVFNANNFNVTTTLFTGSGSTTRTLTMGSGTWTVGTLAAAGATIWNLGTTTNLTFNKDTANIVVGSNGISGVKSFTAGSLTYNGLTIDANTGQCVVSMSTGTYSSLSVGAGNLIEILNGNTLTVSAAFDVTGTAANPCGFKSNSDGSTASLSVPSGTCNFTWCHFRNVAHAGGATFLATNSFNMGGNTGITISAPSSGAVPTVADIVAGVWDEPTAGNVTAGTFGAQLKTVLDTAAADAVLIKAKTDNLPSDPADASVIAARFDTLDTSVADLPTNAELATALGTADDAVLAEVALVKAKTDSLTFTVAGQVDVNIKSVAGTTVTGVGSEADPWGP